MKIFLDSNVIVSWIILRELKIKDAPDELWKQYTKVKPSFELIEKILEDSTHQFIVSNLSVAETYKGVHEELLCRRMRKDGVPLSKWASVKHRFLTEKKDLEELNGWVSTSLEELGVFSKTKPIHLIPEHYNFWLFPDLMLRILRTGTHDAVLIQTAIQNKCDFFVTEDQKILDAKNKVVEIKILHPQEMLKEL